MNHSQHVVFDLFAGTGVGVAVQALGAKEYGVEMMPEAIATRAANGMETLYENVWDAHLANGLEFDTLWASPPCQTFSMAGSGAGRKALDDVLKTIDEGVWRDIGDLKEWALSLGDERIGLVLSPLHYVHRFRPMHIALEQVPPVLPVWQAMAAELRDLGYSVWAGYLNAEQYGVPQTRKRAILIARRDGQEALPPKPTHSRYYPRTPEKLDPGVLKWVSMAEALGWAGSLRSNYGSGGDPRARGVRLADQPASTMTGKAGRNKWIETGEALSVDEAAALQTYPTLFPANGRVRTDGGGAWPRPLSRPAPTVTGEAGGQWRIGESEAKTRMVTVDEAAALQTYPSGWGFADRPAPTVTGGGGKASGIELFDQGSRWKLVDAINAGHAQGNGRIVNPNTPLDQIRLNPDEAATLQSYPGFIWDAPMPNGKTVARTKQFLQIGNAVPPLLAQRVLEAVWMQPATATVIDLAT